MLNVTFQTTRPLDTTMNHLGCVPGALIAMNSNTETQRPAAATGKASAQSLPCLSLPLAEWTKDRPPFSLAAGTRESSPNPCLSIISFFMALEMVKTLFCAVSAISQRLSSQVTLPLGLYKWEWESAHHSFGKMSLMLRRLALFLCVRLVTPLYLTLCHPMDCNPPRSSIPGILQVRILEGAANPISRGSSWLRDWSRISCLAGSSCGLT